MKKKSYLRPDEIAWELSVSRRTVYRLIRQGHFLAFSIRDGGSVRVPVESFEKYVKSRIENFQVSNGIIVPDDDMERHEDF